MHGLPKEVLAACVKAGANPETLQDWRVYPDEGRVNIVAVDYRKYSYGFDELYLESDPQPEHAEGLGPAPQTVEQLAEVTTRRRRGPQRVKATK